MSISWSYLCSIASNNLVLSLIFLLKQLFIGSNKTYEVFSFTLENWFLMFFGSTSLFFANSCFVLFRIYNWRPISYTKNLWEKKVPITDKIDIASKNPPMSPRKSSILTEDLSFKYLMESWLNTISNNNFSSALFVLFGYVKSKSEIWYLLFVNFIFSK